jgi:hypothetical protein
MTMPSLQPVRSEEGVTVVEAAFVLPVVILVFFAIIEFGLLFSAVATTSSSSRAGARFGSANFAVASDKQVAANKIRDEVQANLTARTNLDDPEVLWVYKATSTGTPIGGSFATCATSCFKYTWDTATKTFVTQTGSTAWSTPDACGATIDELGVFIQLKHTLVSGFFQPSRTVKEYTTVRLEPIPLDQCPVGAT